MRIGLDATPALRQGGGIGRYTRELLLALAHQNPPHEFRILAASPNPIPFPLPPLPSTFRVRRLPFHDVWLARLWHRAGLPLPVESFLGRLDLYHATDFTLPPVRPGVPTVLTVHDLSFVRDPESADPGLRSYLTRVVPRSIHRATWVLADSLATRDDLIELYDMSPQKVEVLYPGVDPAFRRIEDTRAVRERYGLGESPFILSLGTLQPRKNLMRLIQAFAQLPQPELLLMLAGGKGWMYQEIFSEVSRLGLEGRVAFPGFVRDADLPALFSAASVFAYPSLYEGFGLPVLEAMACGTPVLTSKASCLPEVAGDAALLVDPLGVDEIAGGLERILADGGLRQTLITNGYTQSGRFRWEASARQLLATYERLAS